MSQLQAGTGKDTDINERANHQKNKSLHSDRNCVVETETKTLIMDCTGSIIPDDESVLIIDGYAFQCCSGLTSITVPAPVTTIEQNEFTSCLGLISVDLSDSIMTIGQEAFSSCRSLKEVKLPAKGRDCCRTPFGCLLQQSLSV